MRHLSLTLTTLACLALLGGCASQTKPTAPTENPNTADLQRAAQVAAAQDQIKKPTLKRKIALGRITNETTYGKSLLRNSDGDPLGKQVTDMLAKTLVESENFVVLERTDLAALAKESQLTGNSFTAVGADVLLIGSLTEFGRKTVGSSGFLSSTKRQVAYAKMDVRVVDTTTGLVLFSCSGAGETANESASVLGWGSRASYDGTLNDRAISIAATEVVNQLVTRLADRPWKTYFLSTEKGSIAISGGKSQGLEVGMQLAVKTLGKKVKSPQTGFMIQLPGSQIAVVQVTSLFGDSPENEGALVSIVKGNLGRFKASDLVIEMIK
jgi:curli biogenesis system outer membrane secretion channel CsgG